MADFAWQPMHTIADYIPAEAPVLFLGHDAAAKDHEIWNPVIGYGLKRDGWREVLLGDVGRREIELTPACWAEIPMPLPHRPDLKQNGRRTGRRIDPVLNAYSACRRTRGFADGRCTGSFARAR